MRPALAQDMANYNRWMNQHIYNVCSRLSDQELREDRKAFFGSIHGTLNHILLGDKIWLGRFLGSPYAVSKLDEELHNCFRDLKTDREITDQIIIDWANGLTDDVLDSTLEYRSVVNPQPRSYEMWLAVNHFFNHQTHHRGQITTLLTQAGLDIGLTDLIWLPGVVERNT